MKEMVGGCCVCSDERGWPDNPLVYCDGNGCTVAVHQACYGIVTVPTGPWFCKKCESPDTVKGKVRCELCPSRSGALKKADTGGWAHVVCALYIPEVRFGNVTSMEPIVLGLIPPERFTRTCYICTENGKAHRASQGACMACNKSGCKQQFHVTCAQSLGLLCEEAGNYLDNVKYCGYCHHHYSKLFPNLEVTVVAKKKGGNVKTIPPYKPVAHDSQSSGSSSEKEGGASPMAGGSGTPTPPSKGSKGPGRKSSQNRDSKSSHTSKASPSTSAVAMEKKKSPSRRRSSTGDGAGSKSSTPAPSPSNSSDSAHVAKGSGSSSERGRDSAASRSTPPVASPSASKSPQTTGVISSVASAAAAGAPAPAMSSASTTAVPAAKPTVTFQESVIINTETIETKHTKKRKAAAAATAAAAEQAAQASANETPSTPSTSMEVETKYNKKRQAAAAASAATAAAAADAEKEALSSASESSKRSAESAEEMVPSGEVQVTPVGDAARAAELAIETGTPAAGESSKFSASVEEVRQARDEVQVDLVIDSVVAITEPAQGTPIAASGESSNFSESAEEMNPSSEVQVDPATAIGTTATKTGQETQIAATGESPNESTAESSYLEEPVLVRENTYPNITITIKKRRISKVSAAAEPPTVITRAREQETTKPSVAMEIIEKIVEEPKYTKKRRAAAAARKETPPAIIAVGKPQKCRPKRVAKKATTQAKPVPMSRTRSVSLTTEAPIPPVHVQEMKLPKKRRAAVAASAIIEKVIAASEGKAKASSPVAGPSEPDTRYSKKRKAAAAAAAASAAADAAAAATASAAVIAAAEAREKAAQIIAGTSEPQAGPSRGSQWEHGHDAPVPMDTSEKTVKKAKTSGNTPPPAHYMSPPPPPPPPLPHPPMRSPRHRTSPMPGTSAMNPPSSMNPPAAVRSPLQHQGSTDKPAPQSPHVFHHPLKPATLESGIPAHSSHGHSQRSNWGGLNVTYEMQQDPNKPGGAAGTSKDGTPLPPLPMPPMPPVLRNKKRAAMAAASLASPAPPPPPPPSPIQMASTSTQSLGNVRRHPQMPPPSQPIYQETIRDSPPVSPNTERQLKAKVDQMYYSRMLSTAPHMLGNELNPDSGAAARLQEQLTAELAAHAVGSAGSDPIVPPPLINKAAPGTSAGRATGAQSLDQLLERQWEQGSQFLMEQAQHFDIASLLSCLHQLRTENVRLEEHVTNLLQRRDHLLAVNARLAIPLNSGGVTDASYHLQFPGPSPPAESGRCSRDGPPPRTPQPTRSDSERHAERAQVAQQVTHQMLMREVQQKPS